MSIRKLVGSNALPWLVAPNEAWWDAMTEGGNTKGNGFVNE